VSFKAKLPRIKTTKGTYDATQKILSFAFVPRAVRNGDGHFSLFATAGLGG
jgi:hypothetical protein